MLGLASGASAVTFDEVVNKIAGQSVAVTEANARAEATARSEATAGNLGDTQIEGEYLWGKENVDNKWNIGVSQSFDWPGVYSARRREAAERTRAARYEAAATFAQEQLNARLALTDYVNACRNIEVLAEVDDYLNALMKDVASTGDSELTVLDINKMKIEHARLKLQILQWEDTRGEAVATLRAIAPTEDVASIISTLDPVYPVYTLLAPADYVTAINNDNRVKSLESTLEATRRATSVAAREALPGFSLGYVHAYEEQTHFNGLSAAITLPLFSARGKKAAAVSETFAASTAVVALRSSLEAEIVSTCQRARRLKESINDLAPVFDTQNNVALLQKALNGGQISRLEFLTELTYILNANQTYLDLLYQYNLAMARLCRYN